MNIREQTNDATMMANRGWRTNTVMAGMFSMLNNSHLRLDTGPSGSGFCNWDDNNPGRMTPSRTPLPSRRNPGFGRESYSPGMKQSLRRDRLPRHLRRKRFELHPMLRRSVCTLILAVLFVFIGVTFILVDQLALKHSLSIRGFTVLGGGLLLAIIGCLWFGYSTRRLRAFVRRIEEAKTSKIKEKQALNDLRLQNGTTKFVRTPSAQWPKDGQSPKNNFSKFQFSLTTPNGKRCCTNGETSITYSTDDDDDQLLHQHNLATLRVPNPNFAGIRYQHDSQGHGIATRTQSLDRRVLEMNYAMKRTQRESAYSEISCKTDPTPHRCMSHDAAISTSCDSFSGI